MVESYSGGSGKSVVVVVVIVAVIASAYLLYIGDSGSSTIPTIPGTGQPALGNYTDHESILIFGDADLLNQSVENEWPGDGSPGNPFRIEGFRIVSDTYQCIRINSIKEYYFIIRNCFLVANNESWGVCIRIYNCSNGVVENCIMETGYQGADFLQSNDCRIANCCIRGVGCGINLTLTVRLIVDDNVVVDCWWAIMLCGANDTQVENNYLSTNDVGVNSQFSGRTILENNTIVNNLTGLNTENNCRDWNITYCNILNNTDIGIQLTASTANFILFNNQIGWNGINAQDDGSFNRWDDGVTEGNSWSDYSGIGVYTIPGSSGSVGHFPTRIE